MGQSAVFSTKHWHDMWYFQNKIPQTAFSHTDVTFSLKPEVILSNMYQIIWLLTFYDLPCSVKFLPHKQKQKKHKRRNNSWRSAEREKTSGRMFDLHTVRNTHSSICLTPLTSSSASSSGSSASKPNDREEKVQLRDARRWFVIFWRSCQRTVYTKTPRSEFKHKEDDFKKNPSTSRFIDGVTIQCLIQMKVSVSSPDTHTHPSS